MTSRIDSIIKAYDFNLEYAFDLVSDVSGVDLYHSPGEGLENHPGFTLGHLTIASAMTAEDLGAPYEVPDGWDEFFARRGPGDPRLPRGFDERMPGKEVLLETLASKHTVVKELIYKLTPEEFERKVEWKFGRQFPTLIDLVTFMCITHEAMHLAQVAAWRRAMGLESSLVRL